MSLNEFIPEIWSANLLVALQKAHVYAGLCNRDYQGEIVNMGDTVRINGIGDITVSNYTKDTAISAPQTLTDAQTVLSIANAKYFNFAIDDVDKAQQNPRVMQAAMQRAAYAVADAIDIFVAGLYTDAATANNVGTSAAFVTPVIPIQTNIGAGTTVFDYLVVLNQNLTQNNVPKQGRVAVVPPWVTTLLKQDFRFTAFNTPAARVSVEQGMLSADAFSPGGRTVLNGVALTAPGAIVTAAGQMQYGGVPQMPVLVPDGISNLPAMDYYIGTLDGTAFYESNNAPHLGGTVGVTGSQDVIMLWHPMGITYADNVTELEAFRPPDRFADAVRGLHLYGARVTRPYAVGAAFLQHP